jgi:hypothetical protein
VPSAAPLAIRSPPGCQAMAVSGPSCSWKRASARPVSGIRIRAEPSWNAAASRSPRTGSKLSAVIPSRFSSRCVRRSFAAFQTARPPSSLARASRSPVASQAAAVMPLPSAPIGSEVA